MEIKEPSENGEIESEDRPKKIKPFQKAVDDKTIPTKVREEIERKRPEIEIK